MCHTMPYTYSPPQSWRHLHNLGRLGAHDAFPKKDHLDAQATTVVVVPLDGTSEVVQDTACDCDVGIFVHI
jgi:hypothetical protein